MSKAIDSLLSTPHAKIKKDQEVNSSKFESLRELRRIPKKYYVRCSCL